MRRHGVVGPVIRPAGVASSWPLPDIAFRLLEPLLLREGFEPERPILVTESSDRLGFVLRQTIEGTSHTSS